MYFMRKLILICFLVVFIGAVSGSCGPEQVDINSASLEDMMKIKYLGGE